MDASTKQIIAVGPSPEEILVLDHSKLQLSQEDRDYIAGFKDWLEEKNAEGDKKLAEERRGPFPLFDLAPEIRNRIYGFVFANEEDANDRNLSNFQLPAITRASKQLRKESLPAFFSDNSFSIGAISNFQGRKNYRTSLAQGTLQPNERAHQGLSDLSGVPHIKRDLKQILRAAGPTALFRDIKINIGQAWTYNLAASKYNPYTWCQNYCVASVELKWERGYITVTSRYGRWYRDTDNSYDKCDIDDTVQAVIDEVTHIVGRQGFKGFTFNELEKITKKLRYAFPQTA